MAHVPCRNRMFQSRRRSVSGGSLTPAPLPCSPPQPGSAQAAGQRRREAGREGVPTAAPSRRSATAQRHLKANNSSAHHHPLITTHPHTTTTTTSTHSVAIRPTLSSTEKSGCLSRRPEAWKSLTSCGWKAWVGGRSRWAGRTSNRAAEWRQGELAAAPGGMQFRGPAAASAEAQHSTSPAQHSTA